MSPSMCPLHRNQMLNGHNEPFNVPVTQKSDVKWSQ
jgi:hypothetical protein